MRLAQRLDGLPLALATAGAYLSQSADSFDDYLQLYNNSWNDLSQYSSGPVDYEERTLYSTWNVSFEQIRDQDPAAAELLRLMAYLDNQDLWYELFHGGASYAPAWWVDVLKSRAKFNQAISILHNYSLLEVSEGRYSLHTCVHDWTLGYLNHEFDWERCRIAIHCVAVSVSWVSEADYWVRNRRVLPHVGRFKHVQLKAAIDWSEIEPGDLYRFAGLYQQNDMNAETEQMYLRALRGYEKALGAEHTSALNTVNNLGNLYKNQGKMAEAEEMYMRALRGKEKAWGAEHTSTLNTVNNLGNLYADQDKMAEAEEMYMRALRGKEKAWGAEHTSTLDTVNNLGLLYANQGKMAEAEEMYMRALRGYEKAWGAEHTSTLDTVNNLGVLYKHQGNMAEAEEMYMRALRGYEKAVGKDHPRTQRTARNLQRLHTRK
jgi:tetratricopeptide (TPR) repeat protein